MRLRGSQPWRTNRARILRANETSAEARLWHELRTRHLAGHKFTRQADGILHALEGDGR